MSPSTRNHPSPVLTAEEAAALIPNGALVGFSGFTPAGSAKAVPRALAARARALHARGEPYKIRVLAGASTANALDEELARAEAISWRAPYQSSTTLREQVNSGQTQFVDMHLSSLPQYVAAGEFGPLDYAVVEATEVTPDGRVYLTTSIGASPTYLKDARRVIIEVNRYHPARLREMADIVVLGPPQQRYPIPIESPLRGARPAPSPGSPRSAPRLSPPSPPLTFRPLRHRSRRASGTASGGFGPPAARTRPRPSGAGRA